MCLCFVFPYVILFSYYYLSSLLLFICYVFVFDLEFLIRSPYPLLLIILSSLLLLMFPLRINISSGHFDVIKMSEEILMRKGNINNNNDERIISSNG
jgi:hypothetical protein